MRGSEDSSNYVLCQYYECSYKVVLMLSRLIQDLAESFMLGDIQLSATLA